MASYNRVILNGNLTRDPELRFTPAGTAIARIGLAVNREWKDRDGNKKEEVSFIDVDAFGKQAETLGKYYRKGRPILVEGRLKQETWEDSKTKEKRSKLVVVMEQFVFQGSAGEKIDNGEPEAPPQRELAPAMAVDDDVPF
jgi:single-strand DNA-binding protein